MLELQDAVLFRAWGYTFVCDNDHGVFAISARFENDKRTLNIQNVHKGPASKFRLLDVGLCFVSGGPASRREFCKISPDPSYLESGNEFLVHKRNEPKDLAFEDCDEFCMFGDSLAIFSCPEMKMDSVKVYVLRNFSAPNAGHVDDYLYTEISGVKNLHVLKSSSACRLSFQIKVAGSRDHRLLDLVVSDDTFEFDQTRVNYFRIFQGDERDVVCPRTPSPALGFLNVLITSQHKVYVCDQQIVAEIIGETWLRCCFDPGWILHEQIHECAVEFKEGVLTLAAVFIVSRDSSEFSCFAVDPSKTAKACWLLNFRGPGFFIYDFAFCKDQLLVWDNPGFDGTMRYFKVALNGMSRLGSVNVGRSGHVKRAPFGVKFTDKKHNVQFEFSTSTIN
jgi:hypothetical protein